jgi:hypothetical protein
MRRQVVLGIVLGVSVLAIACRTLSMSGPAPIAQDAIVMRVADNATSEQVAQLLKQHGAEVAILASAHDSAWYADVATRAGMKTSRAGKVGAHTFAFIGPQALGDTTLSLKVSGGGEVRVHDALYRMDKTRRLDLMAVRIEPGANLRESIKSLVAYVSTDVMATAAVLLAIEPPSPAASDSVSVLMRVLFTDAVECKKDGQKNPGAAAMPLRLFYGPAVHVSCQSAELLPPNGILGHFMLER